MVQSEQRRAAEQSTPTPALDEAAAKVIREKEFHAERLTVQEAVMQLNLAHKQFLVFTDAETNNISVIYRMDDDFGRIETRGHVDDQ